MAIGRVLQEEIQEAVEALRAGELVAFPTETVYGLGANANNPDAVRKIFRVKGRPSTHPVIVHIDHPRYLQRWVRDMPPRSEEARRCLLARPADAGGASARRRSTT